MENYFIETAVIVGIFESSGT